MMAPPIAVKPIRAKVVGSGTIVIIYDADGMLLSAKVVPSKLVASDVCGLVSVDRNMYVPGAAPESRM